MSTFPDHALAVDPDPERCVSAKWKPGFPRDKRKAFAPAKMRGQKDEIIIRERWLRSKAAFSAGTFHLLGPKLSSVT